MTHIQPNKQIIPIQTLIILFLVPLFVGIILFIVFYNQAVNARHSAALLEVEFQKVQTGNAELKGKLFQVLSDGNLQQLAADHGLVKDKTPQYVFQTQTLLQPRWEVASQY